MKREHWGIPARWLTLAGIPLCLILLLFGSVYGQLVIGTESQVNTTTVNRQGNPAVAMDTAGNYIVVWESLDQDGSGYGIYFQRYNSDGTPNGSETLVNTSYQDFDQRYPDVAMGYDGNFTIVWMSYEQDGEGWGVYRRSYDNTGSPVAGVFRNNVNTSGHQRNPRVAADKDGNFVVVWTETDLAGTSHAIMGRRCNASGGALATEFQVNASAIPYAGAPSIASDSNGNFMVVWQSSTDGNANGIEGILYDSTGAAVSADIAINTTTSGNQIAPDIAALGNGNYVITWASFNGVYGIYAKIVDKTGATVLSDYQVYNDFPFPRNQEFPSVAAAIDEGFIITWSDYGRDGSYTGQYASLYSNDGLKIVSDYIVNTTTNNFQQAGDVAWRKDGKKAAFAWQSGFRFSTITQDGDDYGIYSAQADAFLCPPSIPPTAMCQNITVYLDGTGNASITTADVDGGSSDIYCGIDSMTVSKSSFGCVDTGANSVILTVYSGLNKSATCGATVTVVDSTSPSAVCKDLTVYLDGSGNASITTGDIDNGSSDNCGINSLIASKTSFTCADAGANNVVLTVRDVSGNTSTCTSSITVVDSVGPTAACQNITVYLNGGGSASITGADLDGGSTDDCGVNSFVASPSNFVCADTGVTSVLLTVSDLYGNSSSCTATVTVIDTVSPVAVCQNITLYLDGSGNASITAADVDNGSSDNCGINTLVSSLSSFSCADTGAHTAVLTVTDVSGNSSSCTSTVTVADSTSPNAVCQNLTVYLDGSGNATITSGDVDNGSSDNCGINTLSASPTSFTCANTGANTVVLSLSDVSSNSSNCTSTVTVVDSTTPTAVCQNLTVYLDGSGNATITSGDVDNGSSDNCNISSAVASPTAFNCANTGANTVTLTVTDNSSNSASCTSTVTVVDSTAPTAVCQNLTVYLDGSGNASITTGDVNNGSSDNCSISSTVASPTSFTCANLGTNTVTLTVTDPSSNSASCTSTVTVIDSTAPTATCQNISVYLDGGGNASIVAADIDNGSSDNCSISSYVASPTSFSCSNLGANTVTLTVTDGSSNSASCASVVTVVDSTAPAAVCQNLTVYLDGSGNATITSGDVDNGSSDNCSISTTVASPLSFSCVNLGSNTVTLTIIDGSSNNSTCTSTVTVIDSTAPTAVCQNISIFLDGGGNATITAADVDGGSSDNCIISSVAATPLGFTCADVGANTVTLTVTDNSSNSSTCTSTVTLLDTTPTAAVCQDITVYLDGNGSVSITADDVNNGSSDNCGVNSTTATPLNFTCADLGANTVTLTVTDNASNSSSCTSTVTVIDSTSPTIICQNINVYLDAGGNASITAADVDNGSNDNCSINTLSASPLAFTCGTRGANTVTLTATDISGNSASCTATVTVNDTIPRTPHVKTIQHF
jgi:hypothetical protein